MRNRVFFLSAVMFSNFAGIAHADALSCPTSSQTTAIDSWRGTLVQQLVSGQDSSAVTQNINQCFAAPRQAPACVSRVQDYALRYDLASANQDVTAAQDPHKQPPAEFLAPGQSGLKYIFRQDVEQLAKDRGWVAVRYKSRHSGGFDSETPSLLMVYVPGSKVNPPVTYDRWLNFAIPADTGDDELNPTPQAKIPGDAEYSAETSGGASLPRTFTMVTMQRGDGTKPSQVYFQQFYRSGSGQNYFEPLYNATPSSCVSCHPNGLRAISPLGYHVRQGERQLPPDAWKAVKTINDAMVDASNDAVIDWRSAVVDTATGATKPLLRPLAQGPILGPIEPLTRTAVTGPSGTTQTVYPTRTQDFIMGGNGQTGCYNSRTTVYVTDIFGRAPGRNNIYTLTQDPPVNWQKVANAMSCENCHDGSNRGAFNQTTDLAQVDFKILVDQSMPMGYHKNPMDQGDPSKPVIDKLNLNERIALANCLRAEFEQEQKALPQWLTATSCTSQQ